MKSFRRMAILLALSMLGALGPARPVKAQFMTTSPFSIAPGTSVLFVANAGSNAISAFPLSASGNVSPLRVISGPNTHLKNPVDVALDAAGHVFVLNGQYPYPYVTMYAHGAAGNVAPLHAFRVGGSAGTYAGERLAVTPDGSTVFAALRWASLASSPDAAHPGAIISAYAPTGAYKSTLVSAEGVFDVCTSVPITGCTGPPRYAGGNFAGLVTTSDGRLIVAYDYNFAHSRAANAYEFPFSASAYATPLRTTPIVIPVTSFDYAATSATLVAFSNSFEERPYPEIVTYARASGARTALITGSADFILGVTAIAASAHGAIYALAGNQIGRYNPGATGPANPNAIIAGSNTLLSGASAARVGPY